MFSTLFLCLPSLCSGKLSMLVVTDVTCDYLPVSGDMWSDFRTSNLSNQMECLSVCVCLYMSVSVPVRVYLHVSSGVCLCLCISLFEWACGSVCLSFEFVCLSVCLYWFVCLHVSLHVCMCITACVSVRELSLEMIWDEWAWRWKLRENCSVSRNIRSQGKIKLPDTSTLMRAHAHTHAHTHMHTALMLAYVSLTEHKANLHFGSEKQAWHEGEWYRKSEGVGEGGQENEGWYDEVCHGLLKHLMNVNMDVITACSFYGGSASSIPCLACHDL